MPNFMFMQSCAYLSEYVQVAAKTRVLSQVPIVFC